MSIQIVDNFQLNAGLPIDTRMVASGSVARNAIQYKYEGLRVFDLSDGVPYVWRNGVWSGENASAISGSGTSTFIPRFNSSNTITDSVIAELFDSVNTNILIGYTQPLTQLNNPPPSARLQVKGHIRTEFPYGFFGDGQNVTNIKADNILTGTLNLQRLQVTGNPGFILTRNNSQAVWTDPSNITVNRSNEVKLTTDTGQALRYFVFYDGTNISTSDYKSLLTNNSKALTFQPSTGNIGINLSPSTTIPTSALDVNGQIKLRGGSFGDKKLLMSDANGLASWKPQAEVSVPVGAIIMWGGALANIPTNWVLCDGNSAPTNSLLRSQLIAQNNPFGATAKVPDLRERFVVGAGGENTTQGQAVAGTGYGVGDFGGFYQVTLTAAQSGIRAHSHPATVSGSVGGSKAKIATATNDDNNQQGRLLKGASNNLTGDDESQQSNHTHTWSGTVTVNDNTDQPASLAHENRPPYYALCYIIKIN